MSFLLLSDNVLHGLQSVGNSPLQLDPDPTLYTISTQKRFDQFTCISRKGEGDGYKTPAAVHTSGEEILTFRILVSIISLLSQMDSV